MTPIRCACSAVLVAATLSSWGCGGGGDGLPRKAITGAVTLDGKPLESALVTLMPVSPGETPTPASAQVTAGAFSVPAESGPVAGRYKVSISVMKDAPRKGGRKAAAPAGGSDDEFDVTPTKESLPARYNAQTELTADVTDAGPNEFTFPLTSK